MSQFNAARVWTEREAGDWEACVATSYSMGLLYGGFVMAAPYTQKQRELLEVVFDESQDLGASDAKSVQVYGVKLRQPSVTSSKIAFLNRPGTGFCLTGTGSPVGAQAGTFTHEIFAICTGLGMMAVYDPLLPEGAQPRTMTVAALAAWVRGIAPYQAREVRLNEFAGGADAVIESLNGYADGTVIRFEHGKQYQFFSYEGANGGRVSWAWTAPATGNLDVPCEARVDLSGEGPAYFLPKIYTAPSGSHTNAYLPTQYAPTGPVFPAPPATDPDAAKKAAHDAAVDVAKQAGIPLVAEYAIEKYP